VSNDRDGDPTGALVSNGENKTEGEKRAEGHEVAVHDGEDSGG